MPRSTATDRRPLARTGVAAALGALLAATLLTSCDAAGTDRAEAATAASATPATTGDPLASPSTTGTSPAPTSAAPSTVVRAGDVELDVTAAGVDAPADAQDDTATIAVDPGSGGPPLTIALGTPGEFTLHADGSVTITADDGTVVGGLTPPTGTATFERSAPDVLEVRTDSPTTTTLGTLGVVSADWGDREGGDSLAVDPTVWARSAGEAGVDLVWAELVAGDADVDSPTMHDQLVCHSIGAPDKATWNLEPWRPDVGLLEVLAARCNPTG